MKHILPQPFPLSLQDLPKLKPHQIPTIKILYLKQKQTLSPLTTRPQTQSSPYPSQQTNFYFYIIFLLHSNAYVMLRNLKQSILHPTSQKIKNVFYPPSQG